jgi:hypothetical protein
MLLTEDLRSPLQIGPGAASYCSALRNKLKDLEPGKPLKVMYLETDTVLGLPDFCQKLAQLHLLRLIQTCF